MYIIVGLGNPGKKYENTRHNIGFITLDHIAEKNNIKINKIKHKALLGEGTIGNEKVLLVKPQTFMNLSGNSIKEIVDYYKESLDKLIVIYDDIDVEVGKIRIRKKGSAGTHNGMRSIIYNLVSDDFPRIRIGIGKDPARELSNYVLDSFHKEEINAMRKAVEAAAAAVETWLAEGIDKAMNEYN
ncbi:MAG: aminoacyl-tRNA hydrolase [Clostridiales bacterium]|nr:aminoacyl-tRNA hydrolase [Clostridiales bacterium]